MPLTPLGHIEAFRFESPYQSETGKLVALRELTGSATYFTGMPTQGVKFRLVRGQDRAPITEEEAREAIHRKEPDMVWDPAQDCWVQQFPMRPVDGWLYSYCANAAQRSHDWEIIKEHVVTGTVMKVLSRPIKTMQDAADFRAVLNRYTCGDRPEFSTTAEIYMRDGTENEPHIRALLLRFYTEKLWECPDDYDVLDGYENFDDDMKPLLPPEAHLLSERSIMGAASEKWNDRYTCYLPDVVTRIWDKEARCYVDHVQPVYVLIVTMYLLRKRLYLRHIHLKSSAPNAELLADCVIGRCSCPGNMVPCVPTEAGVILHPSFPMFGCSLDDLHSYTLPGSTETVFDVAEYKWKSASACRGLVGVDVHRVTQKETPYNWKTMVSRWENDHVYQVQAQMMSVCGSAATLVMALHKWCYIKVHRPDPALHKEIIEKMHWWIEQTSCPVKARELYEMYPYTNWTPVGDAEVNEHNSIMARRQQEGLPYHPAALSRYAKAQVREQEEREKADRKRQRELISAARKMQVRKREKRVKN